MIGLRSRALHRGSSSSSFLQRRSFAGQLSSFTSSSPSSLLSQLRSHLSSSISSQPPQAQLPIILYCLPTSLPSSALPPFLDLLQTSASSSIGLLSSPLPSSSSSSSHTISLALLDPATTKVFRSESKGRDKVTVGRWRPLNEPANNSASSTRENELETALEAGDWSSIWNTPRPDQQQVSTSSVEKSSSARSRFKGLEDIETEAIDSMIVLSTPSSAPSILQDLFELAPNSNRLGLIAPPTPFITGRPFALYLNDSVLDDGSVGLALLRSSSSSELFVGWEGLEQLSPLVCEVKEAQGNMLLGINVIPAATHSNDTISSMTSPPSSSNSNNPTQHLISLLASSPSPSLANAAVGEAWLGGKEKAFFLGFLGSDGRKITRVVKILSGDPKRGGMALDSEESLRLGEMFVFLHRPSTLLRPSNSSPNAWTTSSSSSSSVDSRTFFSFSTVPESPAPSPRTSIMDDSETVVVQVEEGLFRGGSKTGFLFGARGEQGWVDGGVEGGFVRLRPL